MTALAYLPDTGDLIWTDYDPIQGSRTGRPVPGLVVSPSASTENTALFLISEDAGFITGQTIHVKWRRTLLLICGPAAASRRPPITGAGTGSPAQKGGLIP